MVMVIIMIMIMIMIIMIMIMIMIMMMMMMLMMMMMIIIIIGLVSGLVTELICELVSGLIWAFLGFSGDFPYCRRCVLAGTEREPSKQSLWEKQKHPSFHRFFLDLLAENRLRL